MIDDNYLQINYLVNLSNVNDHLSKFKICLFPLFFPFFGRSAFIQLFPKVHQEHIELNHVEL